MGRLAAYKIQLWSFARPICRGSRPAGYHRPGQRIANRSLVQIGVHASAQLDVLEPMQDKHRALDPPQFAQRDRQAVLALLICGHTSITNMPTA